MIKKHLSVVRYRSDLHYFQMLGYTFLDWIMVYVRKCEEAILGHDQHWSAYIGSEVSLMCSMAY